jgi:hypothetical protein
MSRKTIVERVFVNQTFVLGFFGGIVKKVPSLITYADEGASLTHI